MNRTNEIETVAAELGYTESMDCSALDYIIETAKASVMVNQKNVELVAQVAKLSQAAEQLLNADDCEDDEDAAAIHAHMNDVMLLTPTQCLNQIKAEAGMAGYRAAIIDWANDPGNWFDDENNPDASCCQYGSLIARGNL